MAGRESAGAVYVTIDADASPLLAKYQQAEAQSRAAGQRIASGLGQGLSSATGIVDQFGRYVTSGIVKPLESVQPVAARVVTAVKEIGNAATEAAGKTESFVGVIPGLGRAAERFIGLLPGVGQAIMAAFPLLGAIALAENIAHLLPMAGKLGELFGGVAEQERIATEQAKRFDEQIKTLKDDIESLDDKKFTDIMGGTAGAAREAAEMASQIRGAQAQIALIKQAIGSTASGGPGKGGSPGGALRGIGTVDKDGKVVPFGPNDLNAAELNLVKLQKRQEELSRGSAKSQIEDSKRIESKNEREAKATAAERKRQAREAAEFEKRSYRAAVEGVAIAKREAARDEKELIRDANRETMRGIEESAREFERDQELERREIVATTAARNKAAQEQIRAQGIRIGSSDEIGKLQIEQAYALQIVHTRAEELRYAQDIATAEQSALADRIASLQLLKDFQSANALYDEANRTDLEIERAKSELRKQEIQDATKIAQAKQQASLGGQIRSAVGTGPATILDARNQVVAQGMATAVDGISGALGRAVQGGQKLSQIFTQLGRSILGSVVQGIAKIGLQMAVTAVAGKALGSAVAVAEVTSAAAVGAANAAAATAAIPIIGPALAPAAAAATFAEIMAFAPLASYDKGGMIPEDQLAMVHKGEFVLTADQVAGRSALPSLPAGGGINSGGFTTASQISNSSSQNQSNIFHLHGIRNVEDFARRLPNVLKSRAPNFSPATR